MMAKKYYWLKLQKDFFKRHDIRIVEGMQNGKDYVLFYMKLLVESISHEGNLRFSQTIPYNDDMLSTITNTNIDIVRSAVKLFCELDLMEMLEDGTIFMKEVSMMMGTETEWAEKKRLYREQKTIEGQKRTMSDKSKSIELDIENKERAKSIRFSPPSISEISAYCKERNNRVNAEQFFDHYSSNGWMVGKNKMKEWKAAVRTWEKRDKEFNPGRESSDAAKATTDVFWKICPDCGYQVKTIKASEQCPSCGEYGTSFIQGRGAEYPRGMK